MSTGLFILCIAAIVISIWLALKTGINLGIVGLGFAFILGYFFVGQSPSQVFGHISLSLLRSFTLVCGMFYFVRTNGAMENLGRKLLYATRRFPWAINIMFFLIGGILTFVGADTTSVMALLAAIAFGMYHDIKVHPMALVTSIGLGAGCFTLVPWGFNGLIVSATIEQYFDTATTWNYVLHTSYTVFLVKFVIVLLVTLLTGSFKSSAKLNVEKPGPLTSQQKLTLWTTFVPVAISLVTAILSSTTESAIIDKIAGFCQIFVMATFSIIINVCLKQGNTKDVIMKGMPWNMVMLSTGMYCLIGVCTDAGMAQVIASFMGNSVPVFLIPTVLTLLGGIMSVFAGASTTVFQLLMAVGIPLCSITGISPQYIISSILAGSMVTAISPFSAGGALIMGYCDLPELHEKNYLFMTCIKAAGIALLISCILTTLHIYPGAF